MGNLKLNDGQHLKSRARLCVWTDGTARPQSPRRGEAQMWITAVPYTTLWQGQGTVAGAWASWGPGPAGAWASWGLGHLGAWAAGRNGHGQTSAHVSILQADTAEKIGLVYEALGKLDGAKEM